VCFVFGSHVQHELENVKGRNEKDAAGRREILLKALLSDDPDAKYATPVATM
jgi:hypothetical protein